MFFSSFQDGVEHRQGTARYSTGGSNQNTGYMEVVGKGKQYMNTPLKHLGTAYKYPTLVLNVGGFTNANEGSVYNQHGGSLCLSVPDGTPVGGDARGYSSIDLQSARSASRQVASGVCSSILGVYNQASGVETVAVGIDNTVAGGRAKAFGSYNYVSGYDSHALGGNNRGTHRYSTIIGRYGASKCNYGVYFGDRGVTMSAGTLQVSLVHYICTTTEGIEAVTATTDTLPAQPDNQYVFGMPAFIVVNYKAMGITSGGEVTAIEGKFCMKKGSTASTTALVGTHTSAKTYGDSSLDGCEVTVTADTAYGCPKITIKGVANKTIRWNCSMNIEETGY